MGAYRIQIFMFIEAVQEIQYDLYRVIVVFVQLSIN